jgi:hypothetical protein
VVRRNGHVCGMLSSQSPTATSTIPKKMLGLTKSQLVVAILSTRLSTSNIYREVVAVLQKY